MKKLIHCLSLLLSIILVIGVAGCGVSNNSSNTTAENKNKGAVVKGLSGKELVIMDFLDLDFVDGDDQTKDAYYYKALLHHALDEFCEINDCTWTQMQTRDLTVLASAIAAGTSPDLFFGYDLFPSMAAQGLSQDLSEYYEQITKKYGSDVMDVNLYKGGYYAVALPWNEYSMIGYNRAFFDEHNIKTPRSYFEEGTWNWDNFANVCKSVTLDLDNDGNLDTYALSGYQWAKIFTRPFIENSDGSLKLNIDNERTRQNYQMMYDLNNYGCLIETNDAGVDKVKDGRTGIMQIGSYDIYDINGNNSMGLNSTNSKGTYVEVVPTPVWKNNDEDYYSSWNMFQFSVPKGADIKASMALMDYLLESGVVTEMKMNSGYEFNYTGLQGLTPESKEYIKSVKDRVAKEKADIAQNPYYSADYNSKVIDWVQSKNKDVPKHYTLNLSSEITANHVYDSLWKLPPATSISTVSEKLQLSIDQYNGQYVN